VKSNEKTSISKIKIKKGGFMTNLHGMTLPTCDILVNGQKRKLYGKKKNKVYLHNGDNFQLQIFNPLQERIGVQLCMNGQKVDDDLLVINPGQEILIERFIGTNRKMTFSAYEIDTSKMSESRVKEAVKAIEKNGILEVVFWNEKKPVQTIFTASSTTTITPNYIPTYPTNPDWITFNDRLYDSSHSITSMTSGGTAADITISASDVVINGNLKINGSLDINDGQLTITRGSKFSSSGTSGLSGTSGTSGATGSSGLSGTSGTRGGRRYSKPNISTTETDYSQYLAENTENNINYSQYVSDSSNFNSIDFAPQEMSRGIFDYNWQRKLIMDKMTAKWNPIREKKIETGRIEKGEISNQYFRPIQFEIGEPFYRIKFKLLPFSLKPVKKKLYDSTTIKNVIKNNTYVKNESDIREYCKKCGYRISRGKGTWDFCPRCGKKIKK
jgi:hypothetical protein